MAVGNKARRLSSNRSEIWPGRNTLFPYGKIPEQAVSLYRGTFTGVARRNRCRRRAGRPRRPGAAYLQLAPELRSEASRIHYFLFDLLCCRDRDLTRLPVIERRVLLKSLNVGDERIKVSDYFEASANDMLLAVRDQGLEGIVGKRRDSFYEPGKRSGAWIKHRVNLGQEFVVGGYTPGPHGLDAIIVGYYRGDDLVYVARTRNGFVPASRRRAFEKLRPLVTPECPFVNLPETRKARWGEALTAEKMKKCVWVRPEVVAQVEFLEWTDAEKSASDYTCSSSTT
jgi:ATP-dependent DNA ligase